MTTLLLFFFIIIIIIINFVKRPGCTKGQLVFNLGLFRRPSSNEDENRCGVCPHADHHENLSFIVHVTYK